MSLDLSSLNIPTLAEVEAERRGKPIGNSRFWLHVDKGAADGCWLWTGKTTNGYGVVDIGGRSGRLMKAHRVSYEAFKGPVPDGLDLDHLCRVRNCVNPDHLEPVTRFENLRRSPLTSIGKTACQYGHDLGPAEPGKRRLCTECHRRWDKERRADPARRQYMREYSRAYKARLRNSSR